jgi:hypothetical protein
MPPKGVSGGLKWPVIIAALLAVLVVGIIVGVGMSNGPTPSGLGPSSSGSTGPTDNPDPDPDPGPVPDPQPARPTTPDEAMTLNEKASSAELELEADESDPSITGLYGSWVPQASSKCVGGPADIEPGWVPDGSVETAHITMPQIVAFHLALHDRFGALTVRQTQLGISHNRPRTGACAGELVWVSIVPKTFSSAPQANRWCAQHVRPKAECQARYVSATPGGSKTVARN